MSKKRHGSKHHFIPTSRGGSDDPENIIEIDLKIHQAWHTLFINYLVEEVIDFLQTKWRTKDGQISGKLLRSTSKRNAWRTLFGNANADRAVEIIIEEIVIKRFAKWAL